MGRTKSARLPLTHERIVAAAAKLLDAEGAEALSARRLAAELGCEAMSLYHHVPSMGDLVDHVVDQALAALPEPRASDPPLAQVSAMARAYLALSRARPHLFRVVGTRRIHTAVGVRFQARSIALLTAAGLSPRKALRASRVLFVYLNGAGLAVASWTLDAFTARLDAAPEVLEHLGKLSNRASVEKDALWGLDRLLDVVTERGDAHDPP